MNSGRTACVKCGVNTWKSSTSAAACTACREHAITNGLTGQINNTCGIYNYRPKNNRTLFYY